MGSKRAWSKWDRAQRREEWLRKTNAKHDHAEQDSTPKVVIDYYSLALVWLHHQLDERYKDGIDAGIRVRRDFWHLIPDGAYAIEQAHELLRNYSDSIERRLADEIITHSITYWLYVYRRTAPEAAGPKDSPVTTMQVRQRLEAAFQKYAPRGNDRCIAWSDEVKAEHILARVPGKYRLPRLIDAIVNEERDLVFTDFDVEDLAQLYRCEQLSYELWRCVAAARITSKGADLVVDHTTDACFFDARWEELNKLVTIYDRRRSPFIASATATVFEQDREKTDKRGMVFLPYYNVERTDASLYAKLFAGRGIQISRGMKFNFKWVPFDLKSYCTSHAWLSHAFEKKHGFRFEVALIVLMALLYRAFEVWAHIPPFMYQAFQRGYSGPSRLDDVRRIVAEDADRCADVLEVQKPSANDLEQAIQFLTLSEEKKSLVSLVTGGPCFLFLPSADDRIIVDYSWVFSNLHYLFLGVPMREAGAKGRLLESFVAGTSALPTGQCKGLDNSSRQVDAAFRHENALVIVECKANALSIAYERGDPAALQFRRRAFEEALRQTDDKAAWLADHCKGTNYDISDIQVILPVVVTPFKEFMPSFDPNYWIAPETPRVLMPHELTTLLRDPDLDSIIRACPRSVFVPVIIGRELPE